MAQNNSEEIDLGNVFNKIKDITNKILVRVYHGILFLFRHWWKLLILVIIGGLIGHFLSKNEKTNKEAVLIVQNNFDSTDYVYVAVNQLNQKLKERDTVFLKEEGFRTDTIVIRSIEIEPIVNLIDLLDKSNNSDLRYVETFIENANYKDELLTSELFMHEYLFHKILINTSSSASKKDIEQILKYLNNNEVFNSIKDIVNEESKVLIEQHKETVASINKILESQVNQRSKENESKELLVSMGTDYTDLYQLVYSKNSTLSKIVEIETELTKYDNVVSLINKPVLVDAKEAFGNKKLLFALLFPFLYISFFIVRKVFIKLKTISENLEIKN